MASSLLILTLVALFASGAFGCSCAPSSFNDLYCSADTSVRVRILARIDNCEGTCDPIDDQVDGKITYIARVIKLFKGEQIEDNIMFLNTAVNGALCGVNLAIGRQYLLNLGGATTDATMCPRTGYDVGLCNFPRLWGSVSQTQRRFLRMNSNTNDSLCP